MRIIPYTEHESSEVAVRSFQFTQIYHRSINHPTIIDNYHYESLLEAI